jgi:hypothetical protein
MTRMLKVTVELCPGGREEGRRVLATADISRIKSGPYSDYKVLLEEDTLGCVGSATLRSASVLDLVARGIAAALAGKEELPPRPLLPEVPVHVSDGMPYVRMREIPQPARTLFSANMKYSTCPFIQEDPEPMGCAYASDWEDFLAGRR